MKNFLIDIIVVLSVAVLFLLIVCFFLDGMGWTDWAYKKVISEGNCKSMITGTSRAEQGIIPSVIDNAFELDKKGIPMQNFAFTGETSPYGEVYYDAIKRKLNQDNKNGLFIVSVDPWSLTTNSTSDVAGAGYREDFQVLGKVKSFYKPNVSYFWHYCRPFTNDPHMLLHDNGWLEINVSMSDKEVAKRKETKKSDYNKMIGISRSEYRLEWLKKTIELFEEHGSVVMCRMPVDDFMLEIEKELWPKFDSEMSEIAKLYNIQYISFVDKTSYYRTTDGNHLYKEDAIDFTKALCDSINSKSVKK